MRTSTTVLLLAFALVLTTTACSSNDQRPATVSNYGPPVASRPAPPAPAWNGSPPAAPAPMETYAGPFQWHTSVAAAQAAARASGKLILVTSTKPSCGLCKKFKNNVVPQTASQVSAIAVGFVYDIRPPIRDPATARIDRTLRANLRGADLMPLVGFLTSELQWVHGFYGPRSASQFRGDIATASRLYPVSRAALEVPAGPIGPGGPSLAVVNEYGETEWSAPGDVWPATDPEPIDAITGAPQPLPAALADATPVPAAPAPIAVTAPAPPPPPADLPALEVAATPQPAVTVAPAPLPPVEVAVEAPAPALAQDEPGLAHPAIKAVQEPEAWSSPAPEPAAAAPGEVAPSEVRATDAWARAHLARALESIRGGRFQAARETLTEVGTRMADTEFAREAAKGRVALYNARRIRGAVTSAERSRYLNRARRDLGSSMWSVLFEG